MPDTKNTLKKWEVEGPLTVREVGGDREYYYITGEIGGEASRTIASVGCWTDREGTKEDADLLASAPALVERIKELETQIKQSRTDDALTYAENQQTIDRQTAEIKALKIDANVVDRWALLGAETENKRLRGGIQNAIDKGMNIVCESDPTNHQGAFHTVLDCLRAALKPANQEDKE